MKRFIATIMLLAFATTATAGMVTDFDQVEDKHLTGAERYEYKTPEKEGSSWWKWALGIVLIGGIGAVAASGSSGGSDGSNNTGDTGTVTVTW